MKRNDKDNFPDTVMIGSSALYPLAKGAIQMLISLLLLYYLSAFLCAKSIYTIRICQSQFCEDKKDPPKKTYTDL